MRKEKDGVLATERDVDPLRAVTVLVRSVAFIFLFLMILTGLRPVFQPKQIGDGYHYARMKAVYEEEPDVVFIGSSHCCWEIDPLVIFREQGIDSCDFSVTLQSQGTDVTKLYVQEAIKTYRPKLIVLEPYGFFGIMSKESTARIWLDCIPFSFSKLAMAQEIAENNEKYGLGVEYDSLLSYAFPFLRYHTRWKELKSEDFDIQPYYEKGRYYHGYVPHFETEAGDFSHYYERQSLDSYNRDGLLKAKEYFGEMVRLCEESGTALAVIKVPSPSWGIAYHEMIASWSSEFGVPFIDYNESIEEIGIDAQTDCFSGSHINDSGAAKVSSAIGRYLRENYDLPDHRGDPDYADWEQDWQMYQREKIGAELSRETELSSYLDKLYGLDYLVCFAAKDCLGTAADPKWEERLEKFGLTPALTTAGRTGYIAVIDGGTKVYERMEDAPLQYSGVVGRDAIEIVSQSMNQGNDASLKINGVEYLKGMRGLSIAVYDKSVGRMVDCVTFDLLDGGKAYR